MLRTTARFAAARSDSTPVATLFSHLVEWLPRDFEGPPSRTRHETELFECAVGRVVDVHAREQRVMSDVWDLVTYAVVAEDDGTYNTVCCGSGLDHRFGEDATVDAPAEVILLWKAHVELERVEAAERQANADAAAEQARSAAEAKQPAKGKRVRVVRGRKVAKGTEGVCFWLGQSQWGWRVGLKTDAGETVWVDARNCEAVVA